MADVVERIKEHLRQLAPHVKERTTSKLLQEVVEEAEAADRGRGIGGGRLTHTRTYSTTEIVVYQGAPGTGIPLLIFALDFNITTPQGVVVYPNVAKHLDAKHLHRFWTMEEFTEWLFEEGVVVGKCHWELKG